MADPRCYAFGTCYDLYEVSQRPADLAAIIEQAVKEKMADVDLVISSAVDFRQNEAAASFKISLVFTKRAAFQARYKTLLATATKALEGLAVLHFAEIQNSTVARTTKSSRFQDERISGGSAER